MNIQVSQDASGPVWKIAGALDISEAAALRDALREGLAQQAELAVDLSAVEDCDTAILQVLCAARKSAFLSNKSFRIKALSPAVTEARTVLGLAFEEISSGEAEVRGAT